MGDLSFQHLNTDWNAEPNAPHVELTVEGKVLRLSFVLNPWAYNAKQGDVGTLEFSDCYRWRWDATNDHAWFSGKGLYSGKAPKWGEFYEVTEEGLDANEGDWEVLSPDNSDARHFLFYFRDETIEIIARDWSFARS